jgi:putative hemolysin
VKNLTLERILTKHAPYLLERVPQFIRPWLLDFGERLLHLGEMRAFLDEHPEARSAELLDEIFERLDVGHSMALRDRMRIPSEGRLVVVANHPLGGLDGLAVLRAMLEVRPDVRIVANEVLADLPGLSELFIPCGVFSHHPQKNRLSAIGEALDRDEAVIFFPAAEVARPSWHGIRERRWRGGAVRFARDHGAPVLPVWVRARNSFWFYLASLLSRPVSMLLLPHEMFNKGGQTIVLKVGDPIPASAFRETALESSALTKLLQRHTLRVGKSRKGPFRTESTIAHPVDRRLLRADLRQAELLGVTGDGKRILLVDGSRRTALREVARLRELTFRSVGEGTGTRLDLDAYDRYYKHLVIWDEAGLEITGAYRLGVAGPILEEKGKAGLYSASLFEYGPAFEALLPMSAELGRSFVQQRYWNSRALDQLWQGIGAFLLARPEIRYLFGCVSISGAYPEPAKELLVHFFRTWFGEEGAGARARNPFALSTVREKDLRALLPGEHYREELKRLKEGLKLYGCAIPTLFKQYSELCEPGGTRFLDFGVDPDFGHCVDGFILVDVTRITAEKRARYIERAHSPREEAS